MNCWELKHQTLTAGSAAAISDLFHHFQTSVNKLAKTDLAFVRSPNSASEQRAPEADRPMLIYELIDGMRFFGV